VKALVPLAKLAVSLAIVGLLLRQLVGSEHFGTLRAQRWEWGYFLAACGVSVVAVGGTFVRWCLLVRALGLPFTLKDAMRLGSLGYMLNLVLIGSVGGDLVKAVMAAREQPGRRTQTVAAVLIDRVVGMYSLILLAGGSILLTGIHRRLLGAEIQWVFQAALVAVAVGSVGGAALLAPGLIGPQLAQAAARVPIVGGVLESLIGAARIYCGQWRVLLLALVISLGTNSLFTVTIYLIAHSLPGAHPTLAEHFVVVPLSSATGLVPLPLGALGAVEAMLSFLYQSVLETTTSKGILVALGYRLVTVVVAVVGGIVYVASRREVQAALAEARRLRAEGDGRSATAE
jgi:hypothetical protein